LQCRLDIRLAANVIHFLYRNETFQRPVRLTMTGCLNQVVSLNQLDDKFASAIKSVAAFSPQNGLLLPELESETERHPFWMGRGAKCKAVEGLRLSEPQAS